MLVFIVCLIVSFLCVQLNMDLTMELLDSSDSAVSVTVNSVVGGSGKIAVHHRVLHL
jgi:hypothetical protein